MTTHINTGTEHLVAAVEGAVATITLNNPQRHNAITADMFAGFGLAAAAIEQLGNVRAIVMTGAGDRAFASGADISGLSEQSSLPNGLPHLSALGIPIVAAIRGWCVGGGLMTALYADLRIASDTATMGIPAAKLGVGYPLEATKMLADTIGQSAATEMLLLGETFDAEVARSLGLVHRVVADEALTTTTDEVVEQLVANAPLSIAAAKAALRAATDPAHTDAASAAIAQTWRSDDFREGRAAFSERRTPRFTGR